MALQNPFGLAGGSSTSGGLGVYNPTNTNTGTQQRAASNNTNTNTNTNPPANNASTTDPYGRIFNLPNPLPGDNVSMGDIANMSNYLANWAFSQFGPLTPMTTDIYKQVLSGQLPQVSEQLIAPQLAQAAATAQALVPRAIQQASDQLQGGAKAEAITAATQAPIQTLAKAHADMLSAIQEKLLGGALEAGTNAPTRIENMLTPIALIRAQQQAAKNSGGGK